VSDSRTREAERPSPEERAIASDSYEPRSGESEERTQ
jgi:hypothetical protein